MGKSNPKASLFPSLATKVDQDIRAVILRIDGAEMPLVDLKSATLVLSRLERTKGRLALPSVPVVPMSPAELAALSLLSRAAKLLDSPEAVMMIDAAENGDRHTRHKGTSERWMMHLQAAIAIKAGVLSDPAIRLSTGSRRAVPSIEAWINAGSWAGVSGPGAS